jgi:hypothetical protein
MDDTTGSITLEQILASLGQAEQPTGYLRTEELVARWGVSRSRVVGLLRLAAAQGKLDCAKVKLHDIAGREMTVPAYRFRV